MKSISWADIATALQIVLVFGAVAVSFTHNIAHRAPSKVAFAAFFMVVGVAAWYTAKQDREQSIAQLTGGDNFLVVKAALLPSPIGPWELVLFAYNEGSVQLPYPAFSVSPIGVTWGQPGYGEVGGWRELVLAPHDSRASKVPVAAAEYSIELTAANGPAFETLKIESVGMHKFKQHITINRGKNIVYDRTLPIPQ